MNGMNAAVAQQPAIRLKAWIWFENREPPEGNSFNCTANRDGEKVAWDIELYWDGTIVNDEIHGEIVWYGADLLDGDILRFSEDGHEIGRVWVKGEVDESGC